MMKRIFYVSRAVYPRGHRSDVEILSASTLVNSCIGVTGCLLRSETMFAQSIEGSPEAINTVMSRVISDPCHYDIVKWDTENVTSRLFPEWWMILANIDDAAILRLRDETPVVTDKHLEMRRHILSRQREVLNI